MRLNHHGDTIVEVLLAIAVVSSVIATGFVSANRSLTGTRSSQERGEALKLAEGQVEYLQYLDNGNDIFDTSGSTLFCISESGQIRRFTGSTLPSAQADNFSTYHADCRNRNLRYNLSIQYDATADDTFTVRVRWDGPRGQKDEVRLIYKVHRRVATTAPSPPPPTPPDPTPPASACVVSPNPISIPEIIPPGESLSLSHLYYDDRLQYNANISTATSGLADGCRLRVLVSARDPGHPGASNQPNERLYIIFHLRDGGTVTTGLTNDLPSNQQTNTTDVGTFTFPSPPVQANFRHYYLLTGDSSNANSIDPAAISFEIAP